MKKKHYEGAIEAILFTMGEAVPAAKIAAALELSQEELQVHLAALMKKYEKADGGIQIVELDGSYQMCTNAAYYEDLIKIAKQPKKHVLTDVILETLSIVAYRQPVTKIEIEKIRGVSCEHAVNKLVEYNLIREIGRLDAPGRPLLFGTTEEFLRCFGVHSLEELPACNPDQIEAFKEEAKQEVQLKLNI